MIKSLAQNLCYECNVMSVINTEHIERVETKFLTESI